MPRSFAAAALAVAAACWAALWALQLARRLWAVLAPCPSRPLAATDFEIIRGPAGGGAA